MSSYYGSSTALSSLYTPRQYSGTYTPSYQYKYSSSTLPSRSRLGLTSDYTSYKLPSSSLSSRIPLGIRATSESPSTTTSRSDKISSRLDGRSKELKDNPSQKEEEKDSPRAGFVNLGNTCFMNAILQCLCHTPQIVEYCLHGTYRRDINYMSLSHGDLIRAFADFVKNAVEAKGAISPHQLRSAVQRSAPRFMGNSQHDAHEFLRCLLQSLHDEVNRVKIRSSTTYNKDASICVTRYQVPDDSLIVDLFAGQLKSTLKCTNCNHESITYDTFWDISLPIEEGSRAVTLRQCFNLFSSPEILDGENKAFCEVCKKKNRSSQKLEIHKFPKILVLHLKRFSSSCYSQKINVMVDCPLVLRNLSEFSSSTYLGTSTSYQLYGVIDHIGSLTSGHYVAKCRDPKTKEWDEFNDASVYKAVNVVTSNSYICFYMRD